MGIKRIDKCTLFPPPPPIKFLLSTNLSLWRVVLHTDDQSLNQRLCRAREIVKKFLCLWVVIFGLFVGASSKSYAQIPVTDADLQLDATEEIVKQGLQYALQGSQHATQLQQYATELKNLLTIGAFIWTMANAIYKQVQDLDNVQSYYQIVYGGIEDYLKDSQDIYKFYNDQCSSLYPAFTHLLNDLDGNLGICLKKTFQKQQNASTVQTKLNTSETQLIAQQQQDLPSESARITAIQNQPETGALQAMQVETQLLDKIIDELRKLRAVTLAQNAAEAHKREQETQDRARAAVYLHQVYETQGVIYMKSREWR